jgi:hypothetical protein
VLTIFFDGSAPFICASRNFFDPIRRAIPTSGSTKYRQLFGTSNVLLMTVGRRATTLNIPREIECAGSPHHLTSANVAFKRRAGDVDQQPQDSAYHGFRLKTVLLTYSRLPRDLDDLEFFRRKVDTSEQVRGFFVSQDDKATQIIAGFWEEYFDLRGMWKQIQEIIKREEADGMVKIYVSGVPILFAYFDEALSDTWIYLALTAALMIALLWGYFRTLQGVVIPTFSGLMSVVWGLGSPGSRG